jgi:hypothetical protein
MNRLKLEIDWVPANHAEAFGRMLHNLFFRNPATLHAAIPIIEQSSFAAELKNGRLLIYARDSNGNYIHGRCASLREGVLR